MLTGSLVRMSRIVLLGLLLCASAAVHAWGAEGHRITGLIAWQLLDAKTRLTLSHLMQGESLADASTYMDRMRPALGQTHPFSAEWHYNDRPVCGTNVSLGDYCTNGNCASVKIGLYMQVLADDHSPRAQKIEALRFLVHMIGDVHQPLHAATNDDRGGNLVKVMVRSRTAKLHGAWDSNFVKELLRGRSETQLASELIETHSAQISGWQAARTSEWLEESHTLARDFVYAKLDGFACGTDLSDAVITLSDDYRERAKDIVAERLTAAGARIAKVLQRALSE